MIAISITTSTDEQRMLVEERAVSFLDGATDGASYSAVSTNPLMFTTMLKRHLKSAVEARHKTFGTLKLLVEQHLAWRQLHSTSANSLTYKRTVSEECADHNFIGTIT